MGFAYTPEQEALRREVRKFIKTNVTPEIVSELDFESSTGDQRGLAPKAKELYGRIYERGWLGITYPKEYGGQGGDPLTQYIVEEEFRRAGVDIALSGSGAPAWCSSPATVPTPLGARWSPPTSWVWSPESIERADVRGR